MTCKIFLSLFITAGVALAKNPILPNAESYVFGDRDGKIAVEAEHFFKKEQTGVRDWKIISTSNAPNIQPDGDPSHASGASRGAYLEALPDTRRNHGDPLKVGENFSNEPGKMAILSYKVHVPKAGRYYVWVRTYSTNTEDNGIHVGLNGEWPATGQRMQWTAKNKWAWGSKQRTAKVHTGVPGKIWLDISSAGQHVVQFSMREDGFEFDKFVLTPIQNDEPKGTGPEPRVVPLELPEEFPDATLSLPATQFKSNAPGQYIDRERWLAVDPEKAKSHLGRAASPFPSGKYDVTLYTVGENDGQSAYTFFVNGESRPTYKPPLSKEAMVEGKAYAVTWEGLSVNQGDVLEILAHVGTDGKEFARARWVKLEFLPSDEETLKKAIAYKQPKPKVEKKDRRAGEALHGERKENGDGSVDVSGALRPWHPLTLTLNGPYAHEKDKTPNPFTDYRLTAEFTHSSGLKYSIPGYFAADGNAGETSAESGTKWRAHLSPDLPGKWTYLLTLEKGKDVIYSGKGKVVNQVRGEFEIDKANEAEPGFYAEGRLQYVGRRYLQFAESKRFFFKAGADAPETLLAFADFDGTIAHAPKKCPLKQFKPHLQDWKTGDPTWKDGKGKGLIGAINYLADKGVNAVSFLTYNAGGDGDNVWPYIARREVFHFDCSKLDQWNIVFNHAQNLGLYLHFKTQETENDDHNRGYKAEPGFVETALDGGDLGPERKLYYRELIARFGHHLALNWNMGEENTQTPEQQIACATYVKEIDAYNHNLVIHTYPGQQEKVYRPLLEKSDVFSGASLQNDWSVTHKKTLQWIEESKKAGKQWVVANDEQGTANAGVPPDTGYRGFEMHKDKKRSWDMHSIRKSTLWGNLMAGGAGVEYYFGYQLAENDLLCEDWRSRDKSWEYAAIAIDFFEANHVDIPSMVCRDDLVGNPENWNSAFCMASETQALVYLPAGGKRAFNFPNAKSIQWFNPRTGEMTNATIWKGTELIAPDAEDWLAVLK